jgi:hypothetical protein
MMAKVDWEKVRQIMAKSVRGGKVTETDEQTIKRAFKSDPQRYAKLSNEVRTEAFAEEKERWR